MNSSNNQISTLNNLITTLYDGENGYKEAAEEVDSTTLAARFRQLAQQRYDFGHEIKPLIKQFGGEVNKGGSTAANLHRVWMDLKSAVSGNDEEAILNECIRGEESAVKAYAEALEGNTLTGPARDVVSRQMDIITSSVADLRKMAKSFATA
ncbi:ferritin-like domain-containing protein [Neolewinella persica]|uniref:ferritin-like domain-containing protein n=1 Tax=Neolewinella persica TaxID=70998 RepID=UPI0003685A45|nr:PA2169 family four-helix-bundle protein [Neolewinella persica]